MTWQHPLVFLIIPVALAGAWLLFRVRQTTADARWPHVARRWADRLGLRATPPVSARGAQGLALALAAALALTALARPQWGEVPVQQVSHAREVMIALDLSQSMMADDVAPSRLARAKLLVDALLDQLRGERVGLVVFAGTAFVQSPLSADYEVLREFLAALDPAYLPQGGTDYAAMLQAALGAFGADRAGDRYLVVLSDGEAHDAAWQQLAPTLRERGIRVVGLGVGTPAGALVPAPDGGVLKDAAGNAVLSKLEPATLQQLAEQTGGTYRDAATWVDIADLVNGTVALGRTGDYVEERGVRLQDRFQWFLAPALLLFLLSFWLELPLTPLARTRSLRGRGPHRGTAPALAAALLGLLAWPTPRQALAVATDPPPPSVATASSPPDLVGTIAELSAKPALAPADLARLADDTIGFAAQPGSPRGEARDGIIDDALAAVDRGERDDARAADWPALRARLEALRTPPGQPQTPQQKPQDQPRDQQGQQAQTQQNQAQNEPSDQKQPGQQGQDSQQAQQQPPHGAGSPSETNQPQAGDNGAPGDQQQPSDRQARAAGQPGDTGRDTQLDSPAADRTGGAESPERREAEATEPQPDDTARADAAKPLDAPGLGDEPAQHAEEGEAAPGQPQPAAAAGTRMVGGGQVVASAPASDDPATADALARMARVKSGDAPAVLFDRMNRADGMARSNDDGKNW